MLKNAAARSSAKAVMTARCAGERATKRLTIVSNKIARTLPEDGHPCCSPCWMGRECAECLLNHNVATVPSDRGPPESNPKKPTGMSRLPSNKT